MSAHNDPRREPPDHNDSEAERALENWLIFGDEDAYGNDPEEWPTDDEIPV